MEINNETDKQLHKGNVYSMAAHIEHVDQQQDELWREAMTTVYETAPVVFRLLSNDFEVSYADVVRVGIRALVREAELHAADSDNGPGDEGAKEVLQWCRMNDSCHSLPRRWQPTTNQQENGKRHD